MDIFQAIRKDHRKIRTMLEGIGGDYHRRKRLMAAIRQEVEIHLKAEEKILHPILDSHFATLEEAERSRLEHHTILEIADRLSTTDMKEEDWMKLFFDWKNMLIIHMEEEEKEVLPEVRNRISEADSRQLAVRLEEEKSPQKDMLAALGLPAHLPQINEKKPQFSHVN